MHRYHHIINILIIGFYFNGFSIFVQDAYILSTLLMIQQKLVPTITANSEIKWKISRNEWLNSLGIRKFISFIYSVYILFSENDFVVAGEKAEKNPNDVLKIKC